MKKVIILSIMSFIGYISAGKSFKFYNYSGITNLSIDWRMFCILPAPKDGQLLTDIGNPFGQNGMNFTSGSVTQYSNVDSNGICISRARTGRDYFKSMESKIINLSQINSDCLSVYKEGQPTKEGDKCYRVDLLAVHIYI